MAQRVPLGPTLQGHDDEVVGAPEMAIVAPVEVAHGGAGDDVGSVPDHQVDGVETPHRSGLRPGLVEGQGHADGDASADQGGGGGDMLGTHQVEGAALIVGAPASPVAVAAGQLEDGIDVRRGLPVCAHPVLSVVLDPRPRALEGGTGDVTRWTRRPGPAPPCYLPPGGRVNRAIRSEA